MNSAPTVLTTDCGPAHSLFVLLLIHCLKKNTLEHNNSHSRRTKPNGRSMAHHPQELADLKSAF